MSKFKIGDTVAIVPLKNNTEPPGFNSEMEKMARKHGAMYVIQHAGEWVILEGSPWSWNKKWLRHVEYDSL